MLCAPRLLDIPLADAPAGAELRTGRHRDRDHLQTYGRREDGVVQALLAIWIIRDPVVIDQLHLDL